MQRFYDGAAARRAAPVPRHAPAGAERFSDVKGFGVNRTPRGLAAALGSLLLTLALGAAGGACLAFLSVPAGWLSGSMLAVGAATLSGWRVIVPDWLRNIVFVFLGVSIGTGVTPDTIAGIVTWPVSIMALAVAVVGVIAVCTVYLHRVAGWERMTALFASIPGALSYIIALATATHGVDVRRVAVSQSLRLLVLVALMPSVIVALGPDGGAALPAGPTGSGAGAGLGEVALLLVAGTLAGLGFRLARFPGGLLIGAFVASAVLHGSGVMEAQLPRIVLIPGLVVLGALIGTRFFGATWGNVRAIAATSLAALALAMVVSLIAAGLVSWGLGLPFGQTMLAFAPGGLDVMTLLAFALDLDPAYVAAHQVARYVGIALLLPLVMRLFFRRRGGR